MLQAVLLPLYDVISKVNTPKLIAKQDTNHILRMNRIILLIILLIGFRYSTFSVVENPQFHEFIFSLDKRYQVPTRQTIKNILIKKFNVQRSKICETFINDIPRKIALTSDIWSSAT